MQTATIHSVETMGALDGPGLRYVLFLKGCPLRCAFCHNPDTWAIPDGMSKTSREIVDDVLKYREFFTASKGGFTASGGEPLLRPKFLEELFGMLKAEGIHTAIDTCGYVENLAAVENVVALTDLFLFDIKHLDADIHERLTGVGNEKILRFLDFISERKKDIHIRLVLVNGVSAEADYLGRVAEFLKKYPTISRVDLLPYHTLGVAKWKSLNLPYRLDESALVSEKKLRDAKSIFEKSGFNVTLQ